MRLILALAVLLASPAAAQRFDFREGAATTGVVRVPASRTYAGDYGFEPGQPQLFSVALPEGNYRVTVTLGSPSRASVTTLKAESRRLMLARVAVPRGGSVTRSFIVNIRTAALPAPPPNAPGAGSVRLNPREEGSLTWDDRLTLEVLGDTAALAAVTIEPVRAPTLFLLGDSTVTDQRFEPAASWGQMLPSLVTGDLAIANHAESGETLKSFLAELRLDKVLSQARAGDWAVIQFGHNDQKAQWPQTHAPAATTFRDYLRTYIAELRRVGVRLILATSPERRNWTGTRIRPTLSDYAAAVRAVAAETQVPLIDLSAASIAFYEALGPERAPLAFNDGGRDATHHNNYGAWVLAQAVAAMAIEAAPELARFFSPDLPSFDAARPPAPDHVAIVPSAARSADRPAGS